MKNFNLKLEESISLYQAGSPMLKVCATTGISLSTLQIHLQKRGLSRSNKQNSRKYHVDHDYFSKLNTPEKAYWLGFLYADGYVMKRGTDKKIGVALKSTDINHLEKFRSALDSNYDIKTYQGKCYETPVEYSRLLMTSEKMFDDLQKLGVIERKSLILKYPSEEIVPLNLQWHFLRGYFDGDGSFSKATKGYTFRLCGTWDFLMEAAKFIGKPNITLQQRRKGKDSWDLAIGGRLQVKKIADQLYHESTVSLDRKREIYEQYICC